MQKHEFRDREPEGPEKPRPGDRQTQWLIIIIAILLGLVSTLLLRRFGFSSLI